MEHVDVAARKLSGSRIINYNTDVRLVLEPVDEDVLRSNTELSGLTQLDHLLDNGLIVLLTDPLATDQIQQTLLKGSPCRLNRDNDLTQVTQNGEQHKHHYEVGSSLPALLPF